MIGLTHINEIGIDVVGPFHSQDVRQGDTRIVNCGTGAKGLINGCSYLMNKGLMLIPHNQWVNQAIVTDKNENKCRHSKRSRTSISEPVDRRLQQRSTVSKYLQQLMLAYLFLLTLKGIEQCMCGRLGDLMVSICVDRGTRSGEYHALLAQRSDDYQVPIAMRLTTMITHHDPYSHVTTM